MSYLKWKLLFSTARLIARSADSSFRRWQSFVTAMVILQNAGVLPKDLQNEWHTVSKWDNMPIRLSDVMYSKRIADPPLRARLSAYKSSKRLEAFVKTYQETSCP